MAQQSERLSERLARASSVEEQVQVLLNWLDEHPDQKALFRLMFLYGRVHNWGTVLYLNYPRVADYLLELCAEAIRLRGVCNLALSGGGAPLPLYRILAGRSVRPTVNWHKVHLFWGDERYVPHDDPRSNFGQAFAVWLRDAPIPRENIHPMPTHYADPDAAARAYEATLRAHFGDSLPYPAFDLALLGLGDDGHIASLFPGDPALEETERWVVSSRAPAEPHQRLTLTLPVLRANRLWFLVAGEPKASIIEQLFAGTPDPALPIARLGENRMHFWWLSDELYARAAPHAKPWRV
jgi:6-phosphogluconolactonase